MNRKLWYLKNTDLFSDLRHERLVEIERVFEMKLYSRGKTIFNSQEDNHIYLIKTGSVELSTISDSGKKYILDILKKGSIFGNLGIGQGQEILADAIDDSYVCYLEKNSFFKIVSTAPEVSEKLLTNLFDRLLQTNQKSVSQATESAKQQIIRLLISLGYKNSEANEYITDKYTHEQIANMLGISRQTVTRIINELEREGLLSRIKKQFLFKRKNFEELLKIN